MKIVEALTLGFPHEKLFIKPFDAGYFLYVDTKEVWRWEDDQQQVVEIGKQHFLGIFCPWDSMAEETDDDACLGVIVCSRADLGTVVHECAHAGNHYATLLIEGLKLDRPLTDEECDEADENAAHATGLLFEQIARIKTWEEIVKEYPAT